MKDISTIQKRNPDTSIKFDLVEEIKELEDFKERQRKTLNDVQDQIDAKKEEFVIIADKIVEKARLEAREIISKANQKEKEAKDTISDIKKLREEIKETKQELTRRSNELNQREKNIEERKNEEIEKREKESEEYQKKMAFLMSSFKVKVEKPENLLSDLVKLINLATEKTKYLLDMENEVKQEILDVFQEAQEMYSRATLMTNMFEEEKKLIEQRRKDLNDKEIQLEDRRKTLEHNIKQYGYQ